MSTPLGQRSFKGGVPPTALSEGCGTGDLTLAIATIITANWPSISIGPFSATISRGKPDEEEILVTAVTTSQFTVLRGQGSTSAQEHAIGATVTHTNDAPSMQDVDYHVYDTTRNDHTQYPLFIPGLSGHPTSGTWVTDQLVIDENGAYWECTAGGTPGTWVAFTLLIQPTLSYHAGNLPTNVGLGTNTPTKVMDTASLAIGTWLVNFTLTSETYNDAISNIEVLATVDTATATLTGCLATGADINDGIASTFSEMPPMSLTFIAVVTVAGTLKFVAECSGGSGGNALAATRNVGTADATGYTAIRIA